MQLFSREASSTSRARFCGVPHPGVLTAIAFILGIAQLGPMLVLLPSVGWLYWVGTPGWATALLLWSLPVGTLDNIVRPVLIRRGVQLPLLLIVAGVIGGLIRFGMVGLFIGPVVLAATYTLAKDWVARAQRLETMQLAEMLEPLPVTRQVAARWAALRLALREAGRSMPLNDSWIAATALAHDMPVVSQDDDYDGVPGLDVLRV